MANLPVVNALGSAVYLKTAGAGSAGDPHLPAHTIDGSLPAGTNNIGDVDVLAVVGDNADLDSGAGVDNHALVAIGLPGAGGHVVGDPTTLLLYPDTLLNWWTWPLRWWLRRAR